MSSPSLGRGTAGTRTARFCRSGATPLPVLGLALVALLAGAGTCSKTRACRAGTVFLSVRLGPFSGADRLTVGVSVDGGAEKVSSLPLSGQSGGGVEITFPSGYPAGKQLTLQVSLMMDMLPVASRTASALLSSGCSALAIDFGGGDAGGDMLATSGGQGGGGMGAFVGDAGGGGLGGVGGSDAGGGGRGGVTTGGGTTGGAGTSTAGMGGNDTGGGGAGGVSNGGGGTGGSDMGGGGTAGGGGTNAGGAGGDAGTGGNRDGGVDGGCVPTASTETCYNNLDDDCNGLIDCADPACVPVAKCEPLDPTLGAIGASVQDGVACPVGAQVARTLSTGLSAAPCSGCSCGAGTATVVCSADIFAYADSASSTCGSNTGGQLVTTLDSTQGCFTPNWPAPLVDGFRAGAFQGRATGTCLPIGSATKGTPVWNTTTTFCGSSAVGGGCAAGSACVPRTVVAAGACLLLDGVRACPAAAPRLSAWFTGYSDGRTCGACACGSPSGGNCGPMIIAVGSDSTCSGAAIDGYLRDGNHLCVGAPGVSSAGLQFMGTPIAPTCASFASSSGALSATGPQTLCCM